MADARIDGMSIDPIFAGFGHVGILLFVVKFSCTAKKDARKDIAHPPRDSTN